MQIIRTIRPRAAATVALLTMGTAACGGSGTQPDDMSAEEHRAAGDEHEEEAGTHDSRYDPEAQRTGRSIVGTSDFAYDEGTYNPTAHHQDTAERHRGIAQQHRAAAAALELFEEAQCSMFPPSTRVTCPLLGQTVEAADVPDGVRLRLREGVNADAALDHVRCHLAFARSHGRQGMDRCPLYLPEVSVAPTEDGALILTTRDAEQVPALRERARTHVGSQSP